MIHRPPAAGPSKLILDVLAPSLGTKEYRISRRGTESSTSSFLSLLGGGLALRWFAVVLWTSRVLWSYDHMRGSNWQEIWETSSWDILFITSLFLVWINVFTSKSLVSESITTVPPLGLTLSSRSLPTYFPFSLLISTMTHAFIPAEQILDVVLNEGLRRWAVVGYLGVVVRDEGTVKVGFKNLHPKTEMLIEVWRGVRADLGLDGRKKEDVKKM